MKYHFSKFKFTNNLFFKRINLAEIITHDDKFEINIAPYLSYSGFYYIKSITQDQLRRPLYVVLKSPNEVSDLSSIDYPNNEYYISIVKNGNVVKIFNSNLQGIILKK